MESQPSDILRRRFRRRSSLYNSTSSQSDSGTNLIHASQLNNEKMRWNEFYKNMQKERKKPKVPIKCDVNMFLTQSKVYCHNAANMEKFAVDLKEFMAKTDVYANMEKYHREKLSYIEDMLKENVDEITTKALVDKIVEKTYFQ